MINICIAHETTPARVELTWNSRHCINVRSPFPLNSDFLSNISSASSSHCQPTGLLETFFLVFSSTSQQAKMR